MKAFLLLITTSCISLSSFGQVTDYVVFADSLFGCTTTIGFQLEGGVLEDNGTLYLNWGDGTTSQENFTIPAGQGIYLSLVHNYQNGGSYTIETQVYSGVLGGNVDAGTTETIAVSGATDCGFAGFSVLQSSPLFYFYAVPLDFTDNSGTTQTVTSATNYYEGLNPSNAPYTVSISDAWLVANNLTQTSSDITITSFTSDGWANASDYQFTVTCSQADVNPDFLVSYGYASNFVAPLETGILFLGICNSACSNSSDVTVELTLLEDFIPNTSGLLNASINGNILSFDIPNVSGCTSVSIPFTFPGETAAGTEICFDVNLISATDTDVTNNSGQACGTVLNSYDPNDKQVNKTTILNPDDSETLIYKIQFQNDGNYNAVNVKIADIIDEDLDLSTFKLLDASHNISLSIDNATREVLFKFNAIYLAPSGENLEASQGYVIYSIEENDGLALGTEIENTAHIYFDFNPAIVTNTTYNVNEYIVGIENLLTQSVEMYPNPASSTLTIVGEDILSVDIVDLSGKIVLSTAGDSAQTMNIESLRNGMYQVVITSTNATVTSKLIVRK